jgi:hypothetical protein
LADPCSASPWNTLAFETKPQQLVGAHGVLAVTTMVLVLLADLHLGGS